jgi:hypothetical protein
MLDGLIPEVIPESQRHVRFSTVTELWTKVKDDLNNTKHDYLRMLLPV